MNREQVTQVSLLALGSFFLGFLAVNYLFNLALKTSATDSVLYGIVSAVPPKDASTYVLTDTDKTQYAKHLTTLGDPLAGCGCPSCCAARI